MFSFTPTKTITTGEGAVVTTDDPDLAQQMRLLRNHGMSAPYRHEIVGWNWRLSEVQSAIGCCQVDRLDGILATKRANAEVLGALLGDVDGVTPPTAPTDRDHPYMLYTVQIADGRRDDVAAALTAEGIETRVYFPPVHRQPIFADTSVELPVTEEVAGRILSLPFHTRLTEQDLVLMAEVVASASGR